MDLFKAISRLRDQDIDDLLAKVKKEYERIVGLKDDYKRQLDEYSRDEELRKANDQIRYVREHSLCELSDKSLGDLRTFRHKHYEKCKNSGNYTYQITGTGIGDIITVICPVCGVELDITDSNAW